MNPWLAERARVLEGTAGLAPGSLSLTSSDMEDLLEVARVAAHESGDRRNAPLLCYLVGAATANGSSVHDLAAQVLALDSRQPVGDQADSH
jgi:hypothetical protein